MLPRSVAVQHASWQTRWHMTDMPNFRIYSFGSCPLDCQLATQIEALRARVLQSWFTSDKSGPWAPKCTLVLHGTLTSYRQCVPELADCTIASCAIRTEGPRVTERRIDVRTDCPRVAEYLPHEFTHMALDGRLARLALPCWADEGMATMADPITKRTAHWLDLRCA